MKFDRLCEDALEWISERFLKGKKLTETERAALDTSKKAIERHIKINSVTSLKSDDYVCPRCSKRLVKKPFYCPNCGQHLTYLKGEMKNIITHSVDVDVELEKHVSQNELVITVAGTTNIVLNFDQVRELLKSTHGSVLEDADGRLEFKEYK